MNFGYGRGLYSFADHVVQLWLTQYSTVTAFQAALFIAASATLLMIRGIFSYLSNGGGIHGSTRPLDSGSHFVALLIWL